MPKGSKAEHKQQESKYFMHRTAHELAHLSHIAHPSHVYADELCIIYSSPPAKHIQLIHLICQVSHIATVDKKTL